ncbi:MAG: hypothetical protein COT35_01310 [Nitrospirae bacterium CG08_land_8_20_14_0_20_52_24]|nr:MAG: hypothetical protein COT35_01310 [Nitrospirae bacterium CG08_land_8_20_14_0_20_52_24]
MPLPCLPKKGKVTGEALERESAPAFRKARRRHAGIESAIHALVAGNGLDRCRDKGEAGFRRYVALAILGRNLQTLGRIPIQADSVSPKRTAATPATSGPGDRCLTAVSLGDRILVQRTHRVRGDLFGGRQGGIRLEQVVFET